MRQEATRPRIICSATSQPHRRAQILFGSRLPNVTGTLLTAPRIELAAQYVMHT